MLKTRKYWELSFAVILIIISVTLYYLHYQIFHDPHHIGLYLLGDLAFVPIEVLLVTLVIDQLLENRDKKLKLDKLNMVIGTYFSTIGTSLLALFSDHDPERDRIKNQLVVKGDWNDTNFSTVKKFFTQYRPTISMQSEDLVHLRVTLQKNEDFLIRLLENPVLLEHESFTSLLQASFHLTEELIRRNDLHLCCGPDHAHILGDIERVYTDLIIEWLKYMQYLKNNYPYLFSYAMRTNPFDEMATIEIHESGDQSG